MYRAVNSKYCNNEERKTEVKRTLDPVFNDMANSIALTSELSKVDKYNCEEYYFALVDLMTETLLEPPNPNTSLKTYLSYTQDFCPFTDIIQDNEDNNRQLKSEEQMNKLDLFVWHCIISRVAVNEISFIIENNLPRVDGPYLLSELVEMKLRKEEEFTTDDKRITWITSRMISHHKPQLAELIKKIPSGKILLIDSAMVNILCNNIQKEIIDALVAGNAEVEASDVRQKTDYYTSILTRRNISSVELVGDHLNIYRNILLTIMKIPQEHRIPKLFENRSNMLEDLLLYADDDASVLIRRPLVETAKFLATNARFVYEDSAIHDTLRFSDDSSLIDFIQKNVKLNEWPKCKLLITQTCWTASTEQYTQRYASRPHTAQSKRTSRR